MGYLKTTERVKRGFLTRSGESAAFSKAKMKRATGHLCGTKHPERRGFAAETLAGEGCCGSVFSGQGVAQRLGLFEVSRVKPFGEPAVTLGSQLCPLSPSHRAFLVQVVVSL